MLTYHNFLVSSMKSSLGHVVNVKLDDDTRDRYIGKITEILYEIQAHKNNHQHRKHFYAAYLKYRARK